MKTEKIVTKKIDLETKQSVVVGTKTVEIPETVAEAITLFGEDVCLQLICKSYRISVQSNLRHSVCPKSKNDKLAKATYDKLKTAQSSGCNLSDDQIQLISGYTPLTAE